MKRLWEVQYMFKDFEDEGPLTCHFIADTQEEVMVFAEQPKYYAIVHQDGTQEYVPLSHYPVSCRQLISGSKRSPEEEPLFYDSEIIKANAEDCLCQGIWEIYIESKYGRDGTFPVYVVGDREADVRDLIKLIEEKDFMKPTFERNHEGILMISDSCKRICSARLVNQDDNGVIWLTQGE